MKHSIAATHNYFSKSLTVKRPTNHM